MIKTITELTKNVWEPVTSINTIKYKIPSTGDVFYDTNKSRNYVFDGTNYWKELIISSKDGEFNKRRKEKIKRLFKTVNLEINTENLILSIENTTFNNCF